MSKNYAYITMASSKNYLLGIMTMYLSLKQTGTTIPLYAMLPDDLISSEKETVANMEREGVEILGYRHRIDIPQLLVDNNARQGDHRFSHTFDKLLVFGLTQFEKIVFLDADIYILHSLDHLFDMPHMSAMVAGRSYPGNEDWVDLTSGIMTIVPQDGLVEKIEAKIPDVIKEKGTCGDQDILQAYYADWTLHPDLDMGEKYGVIAGYANYYENSLGYCYSNVIDDPKSVAVIHYAGEKKPWMQQWSLLSVIKQEIQLAFYRLIHKRNTKTVLLEYKHLVRKAKRLL